MTRIFAHFKVYLPRKFEGKKIKDYKVLEQYIKIYLRTSPKFCELFLIFSLLHQISNQGESYQFHHFSVSLKENRKYTFGSNLAMSYNSSSDLVTATLQVI